MKQELLAPAGNIEAFYASINNGANAIYLGLNKFNARAYASNFDLDNLKELVKYAHLRNVKVFVAMNTILFDNELDEIYKIIDQLVMINVDALIIQDLSIAYYILNNNLNIEIHASTQMGIENLEGSKLLKDLGFSRIVYARETNIEILKEIKSKLDIEIETFIHGALCVAYSGNCLISSMIGERSGNRGRCAGSCRQIYTLIDTKLNKELISGYLLSMKDLSTYSNFNDLNFIDSLKIEGRMKDASYVASITSFYRSLIDKKEVDSTILEKNFNRTYTKGYIFNEDIKNITNISRPNNNGYLIGEIVKIHHEKIWIKLNKGTSLSKGDQIRIENNNIYKEISLPIIKLFDANFNEVNKAYKIAIIPIKNKIKLNSLVFKTKDKEFNDDINLNLLNINRYRLPIIINFKAKINDYIYLNIKYLDNEITLKSINLVELAKTTPTSKENIINQINKLIDTPYILKDINIDIDNNIFIPLKIINELRREALLKLDDLRLNKLKLNSINHKEIYLNLIDFTSFSSLNISVEVSNEKQYKLVKSLGIKHIYYKNKIRRNNEIYITDLEYINKFYNNELLIGGLGSLNFYKNKNLNLVGDYSLNVTNHIVAAILFSKGLNRITLSYELNKESIKSLILSYINKFNKLPNFELVVYGRTPLMHTKYCILKRLNMCPKCKESTYSLKDKFESFPLIFNDDCTNLIYNSKIFNIIDDFKMQRGINYYRVNFTNESDEEIIKIISSLKDKLINNIPSSTFNPLIHTRGHYLKRPL